MGTEKATEAQSPDQLDDEVFQGHDVVPEAFAEGRRLPSLRFEESQHLVAELFAEGSGERGAADNDKGVS